MHKGYIFDMDGTLLDSLQAWHNVGNRYLESLGVQGREDLDDILSDMALHDGAEYLNQTFHLHKTIEDIIQGINHIIDHQYEYDIPLKKGVKTFLKKCYEKGYPMYVLTASDSKLAKKAFERLGVIQYFQDIVACHEIGLNKQDPQCYQLITDKINLKKCECIIVEDAYYAVKTAKQGGFYTIAIYDQDNQKDWEKIKQIADESYLSFQEMEVI